MLRAQYKGARSVENGVASNSSVKLANCALAVGAFGIGTGEFAIMGFLPAVASDLGISEPVVGRSIAAYALGVVIRAPAISIIAARGPRRAMSIVPQAAQRSIRSHYRLSHGLRSSAKALTTMRISPQVASVRNWLKCS